MTALLALGLHLDQDLLRGEVEGVALHREARRPNLARLLALRVRESFGQRTVQIDPVVLREIGIERHAQHAVFKAVEHREPGGEHRFAVGLDELHAAIPLDVKDPAIRCDRQFHRILEAVGQQLRILFEDHLFEGPVLLRASRQWSFVRSQAGDDERQRQRAAPDQGGSKMHRAE